MKLVRTFSLVLALAGASTVYADPPAAKAPADKKAPDKAAPAPSAPSTPAPAPSKKVMSAADAAKAEKFTTEFGDAIVKNKAACPKMGAAMNVVIDKHQAWLRTVGDQEPPPASKEKMKAREADMTSAIQPCLQDNDVKAAIQRFIAIGKEGGAGKSAPPPPPAKK